MTNEIDFQVENHGSVAMVTPMTPAAHAWVDENVPLESWQWMGASFAVDPHYLENLVNGIQGDGLTVSPE